MRASTRLAAFGLACLLGAGLADRACAESNGDTWTQGPDLPTPRRLLAAAVESGKLYTFGGCGSPCFQPPLHTSTDEETKVEVYDPATKAWTADPNPIPTILYGAAAVAPGNGRIYTLGGYLSGNVVQEYTPGPVTGSWVLKSPMPTSRYGLAAVTLGGKIYAIGGSGPSNALEMYDPATDTWTRKAPMPTARVFLAAAVVNDKIYAIGGSPDCCGDSQTNVVEIYDPATNAWQTGAPLPIAEQTSAAATGVNGKIYVLGGFIPGSGVQGATFEYDPKKNTWAARQPMMTPRDQAPAVVIGDAITVIGGSVNCHCMARGSNESYRPPASTDLAVTKTDSVSIYRPGEILTYIITVTNKGPVAVTGVQVIDTPLTDFLTDLAWCRGDSCIPTNRRPLDDIYPLPLAAGATVLYTLRATVRSDASGYITNMVCVTAPAGVEDTDSKNNCFPDTDHPSPTADLSITKTDGVDHVTAVQEVHYTITVTNGGPDPVTGALVRDIFPSTLTRVSWTCSASPGARCTPSNPSPGNRLEDQVDLPVNGTATYAATATVGTPATTDTITNVASITPPAGITDPVSKNNTSQDVDTVWPRFTINKTADLSPVKAGETVTYTIVVQNIDGISGTATVTDLLSTTGLLNPRWCRAPGPPSCPPAPASSTDISEDTVLVPAHGAVTYTVTGTVPVRCDAITQITNKACVQGTGQDPVCATAVIDVLPAPPDPKIMKTCPGSVQAGGMAVYTLTVTNIGLCPARGVQIVEEPPAGFQFMPPNAQCPTGFPCSLNDLPAGSTTTVQAAYKVPSDAACGNVVNTATVTSTNAPPSMSSCTTAIECLCDFSLTKTDGVPTVAPGDSLLYTLTVQNNGNQTCTATVRDVALPLGLGHIQWCRGAACIPCAADPCLSAPLEDVLTLPTHGTETYHVSGFVRVPSSCSDSLTNTASVTLPPDQVDPTPDDDTATDKDRVVPKPGVTGFCTAIDGLFVEGGVITYTFELLNGGPTGQADNPGPEFTDTLPAGLTLLGASASSGSVTTAANTVTWNGAIPACASVTITVTAKINAGTAGTTICNQGTVSFDADGDGTNESSGLTDDPSLPGPSDPCCFTVVRDIPVLSGPGLAALGLLLAASALWRLRRGPQGTNR